MTTPDPSASLREALKTWVEGFEDGCIVANAKREDNWWSDKAAEHLKLLAAPLASLQGQDGPLAYSPFPDDYPNPISNDGKLRAAFEEWVNRRWALVPKDKPTLHGGSNQWTGDWHYTYADTGALYAAFREGISFERVQPLWKCKANRTADPPQDCDWPVCGCDSHATRVIEALQESGKLADAAPLAQQLEALPVKEIGNCGYGKCTCQGLEKYVSLSAVQALLAQGQGERDGT